MPLPPPSDISEGRDGRAQVFAASSRITETGTSSFPEAMAPDLRIPACTRDSTSAVTIGAVEAFIDTRVRQYSVFAASVKVSTLMPGSSSVGTASTGHSRSSSAR